MSGIGRLKELNKGDELRVDGEKFMVSRKVPEGLILTPRSENGQAKLDWETLNGRILYERLKGVDPCDVYPDNDHQEVFDR